LHYLFLFLHDTQSSPNFQNNLILVSNRLLTSNPEIETIVLLKSGKQKSIWFEGNSLIVKRVGWFFEFFRRIIGGVDLVQKGICFLKSVFCYCVAGVVSRVFCEFPFVF